ncbi:hypothetical protein EJ04DRAFT_509662 [Polyplosphaeria fusca]|uniref:Nucleoporin NUP37 n=1 Tax=Polyplosphaeria fusca TaxID=682080 RepID=A0A9P4R7P2_9PLEO|nr:hypothetical protein EJ04DRAFT_509662 [Polyplosphaeria fusca]
MKPIASTAGNSTQLRYELPHRVHDAKIYPVRAPNGSTIILYGYDNGVGVIWRGGRPIKQTTLLPKQPAKPAKVNGTNDAIMIIDSDDEAPVDSAAEELPKVEYEEEEEELDPDLPYPSILQTLRLALNTEVLHVAVPQVPTISTLRSSESLPAIFNRKIVFTVACADYSVRIITLPLDPPTDAAKQAPFSAKSQWGEDVVKIPVHAGHHSIPTGVSMTWTPRSEPTYEEELGDEMEVDAGDEALSTSRARKSSRKQNRSRSGQDGGTEDWDLLIASHSTEMGGLLKIWRFMLTETAIKVVNPVRAYQTLTLRAPATQVVFNSASYPKRRHSQILIIDRSGLARVYDPFAPSTKRRRPNQEPGAYVALFRSTFEQPKTDAPSPPILASRKPILSAAWAADGRSIVALLADGEWGVWDMDRSSSDSSSDPSAFTLRSYISAPEGGRGGSPSSPKARNSRTFLTPMTPNTRRTKEETLFQGTTGTSSAPTRGAVSVASLQSPSGEPEDSVIIWYGSETYRISNLGQHRSRAAESGAGSLSSSILKHIQGLALLGEAITSINQFDTTSRAARMAIPRDVLVTAEHRIMILTQATETFGRDLDSVFEQEQAEEEELRRTDQELLAQGNLDLGGMDRLLDNMSGNLTSDRNLALGNPRKVLFASSTS